MKTYLKNVTLLLLTSLFIANCAKVEERSVMDDYNVSWTEKSTIVSDAMPLGNGTTGALVSVLADGHIWVSLRHVDAWSEAHRLLKLGDLEIAQETYRNRTILVDDVGGKNPGWVSGHLRGGWRQEPVMAAMIGLTDSVKKEVAWSLHRPVPELRFPGFFKSTYDGVPDVQHAAMAATALQRMILQDVEDIIILLPAWPAEWDCNFKLFAKQNTIVEGKIELGKLVELKVDPVNRKKDIYIGQDLKKPEDSVWKYNNQAQ